MDIFEKISQHDFEQVVFCHDASTGLKAIIAIHDTTLGPALGGTRMWTYSSNEEALKEVLHLARSMTYKSAAAGLDLGGGKGLIIGDPLTKKSEALFRSYGRFVETLKGRYITAKDMGIDEKDLSTMAKETPWVIGGTSSMGGGIKPSPFTANGVWRGIRAAAKVALGADSLQGLTVAVQGLGEVGLYLSERLINDGARVIATDINQDKIQEARKKVDLEIVEPEEIYSIDSDIFAPCAVSGAVNQETLPLLKCKVVAGGANNVLADEELAQKLLDCGILHAPDYIINAGGLISVELSRRGLGENAILSKIEEIEVRLQDIFKRSREENIPAHILADRYAEERIKEVAGLSSFFLPS